MSAQPNMTEQNLPNGLPPQFGKPSPVPFNGVDSSHSSRTSSPANRLQQIPASQLPPSRSAIPPSQLPPGPNINQLTQNYAHLSVAQATPLSSPKVQSFSTSTPVVDNERVSQSFNRNREFSPIANALNNQTTQPQGMFTHSANSRFNVPSNNADSSQHQNSNQSESNISRSNPAGSLNVSPANLLSNNQINSQSQTDKAGNVSQQDRVRITPQGQTDSNQPKMQQSLSQPLLDTHFKDVPLSAAPPAAQNRPHVLPNFGSTPNLFQNQNLVGQSSTFNQNFANIPKREDAGPQNMPQPSQQRMGGVYPPQNMSNKPIPPQSVPYSPQQRPPQQNQTQMGASQTQMGQMGVNQTQPGVKQTQMGVNQTQMGVNQTQMGQLGVNRTQAGVKQTQMGVNQTHMGVNQTLMGQLGMNQTQAGVKQPQMGVSQTQMGQVGVNQTQAGVKQPQMGVNQTPMGQLGVNQPQPGVKQTHMGVNQTHMGVNQTQMGQLGVNQTQIGQLGMNQTQMGVKQAQMGVGSNQSMGYQQNFVTPQQNLPSQRVNQPPPATKVPPNVPPTVAAPQPVNPAQSLKANLHANRYPTTQPYASGQVPVQPPTIYQNQSQYEYQNQRPNLRQPTYNQNDPQNYNVVQGGFSKMWGQENYDLLQCPNILPPVKLEPPRISLGQDFLDAANCSPDIFRCTMTKIPETNTLLQKARLPLGILIHPFKDLDHLPVIQCSTIVRCRACRTYINPFVFFVDMKRWKCNLCYRVNELPEEFQFDPVSKTYGDPSRRPEIKSSTIEYIAPSEYMLRPPQPAVYLFLLDVSHAAIESGYLHTFCNVLTSNLPNLPGDARTQVGFIAYNTALHFYSFAEGLSQPHEMTVLDIEDVFLPCPDNLIVNLHERKELISDLLAQLPTRFNNSYDTGSALGAALQAAHKMIASTGGRITVFQATLPTVGPGALTVREDPSQRAGAEVHHLNPANDFYKRLALECSGQQIAVDLFVVNSQYVDLATISGISRFSGGCIHHFPLFKGSRTLQAESLERTLKRYLTRKIGFEAVMRIRCTRGLSIHTFHGNFFVRSTDLLSLPNVNPEAGFGMQVSIEESLSDLHTVCFQAALLYTSSKGERRIRVHTLCVPIASTLPDVLGAADQQCIVGLLAKMAVDRSMQSSLADAREAFINVAIDILSSYKLSLNLGTGQSGLMAPEGMKLLPLYISALLKYLAFRTGSSTRLDDRVKAMCDMKSLPLYLLIQKIYPDLYPVHDLEDQNTTLNVDGEAVPQPPHLQLSARSLDSKGAFLMDLGEHMVLLVGPAVSQTFLNEALGVPDYNSISDQMYDLPNLDTPHNQRLNNFINYLNDEKPLVATLQVVRENSPSRSVFIEHLIEDRIETALSYHEFLQHLKTQVK